MSVGYAEVPEVTTLFPQCFGFLLGDTNGDNMVDLQDFGPFVDMVIAGDYRPEADINQDGFVNLSDVQPSTY